MGEQAAQMFLAQSVGFLIESFVTEGDVSSGESFEQFADAGLAEPGEDAFGSLGCPERGEQFRCQVNVMRLGEPTRMLLRVA